MTAAHDTDGGRTGGHAGAVATGRQRRRARIAVLLGLVLAIGLLPFMYPRAVQAASNQLVFDPQPGDGSAGGALTTSPTVKIEDGSNNVVTSDTSTVTLTLANASGTTYTPKTLPELTCDQTSSSTGVTSMSAASGVAAFTNCKVSTGGTYTVVASDSGFTAVTSTSFFVSGPAQLVFSQEPSGGAAGSPWTTEPQVSVEDGNGTVLSASTSQIKLSIKPGTGVSGAALGCTTNPLSASAGEATFAGCEIDKVDTSPAPSYQLVATDGTDGLSAVSTSFDITAGSAVALQFTTEPAGASGGQLLGQQPVVAVVDAGGNTVASNTNTIALSISSGGASGAAVTCAATSVPAVAGVATFSGCSVNLAGTGYILQASDSTISATKTSTAFDISAGSASTITFSRAPSGGAGGAAFGTQPAVSLTDSGGNPVDGPVTLSIKSGTGVSGAHLTCDANPVGATSTGAMFSGCSIDLASATADYVLTATSGTIHADSAPFAVSSGGVAKAAFSTEPGGATGGAALSPQPVVHLTDSGGNPAGGSVALSITTGTGEPGATLTCSGGTTVSANSGGDAGFGGCSIDKIGTGYSLTATSGSASATSAAFNVTQGPPAKLAFTVGPGGGSGGASWSQQPVVVVQDAGGNQVPTSTSAIQLGILAGTGSGTLTCASNPVPAVNGSALYSGCSIDRTASAYRLTAHDAHDGLDATSTPFSVGTGSPAALTFSTQPGGGGAGATFATQPRVTVIDAGGNTVSGSTAGIQLTITPGTGTAGATLSCTSPVAASSGVAAFSGCSIDKAASGYTLSAGDSSDHLSTESLPFAVLAPPPAPLGTAPQNVPAAQTFGGALYGTNPTDTTDDVNTATGALTFQVTDLRVAGIGEPLLLQRTYNSADATGGSFGPGWTSLLDAGVTVVPGKTATVRGEDGQQLVYTWNTVTQSWTAPPGARATLQCGAKTCSLTRFDGVHWDANLTATGSQIADYEAPDGQGLTFTWSANQVTIAVDTTNSTPYNVTVVFTHGLVTKVSTPKGRTVGYGYTGGRLTSVTDVNGNPWAYAYDGSNRLVSETDPSSQARLVATYDGAGHVLTLQSLGSLRHIDDTFTWGSGTVTRGALVNAGGSTVRANYTDTYAASASDVLIQQTNPWGGIWRYSYDAQVNMTESQDPMGWVSQLTYDASNNVITQSTPISSTQSAVVHMSYDTSHRILSQTDGDGNLTSYIYNGPYVAQIRLPSAPHGPGSTFTYNKQGELTQVATPIGLELYTYDAAGNQTSTVLKDLAGHALNGNGTKVTYDEAGDVLTSTDPRGTTPPTGPSSSYTTTHTYDAAGNMLTTTTPGPQTTRNTYDAAGDLQSVQDAGGNTTAYSWNESTLTESISVNGGPPTKHVYDASGDLLSETSPAGRTTSNVFDVTGREVQTTDAQNITTHLTYDIESNIVAQSDSAGDTTTSQYDSQNRKIREVDNGAVTLTSYDPAGNVVSSTDPAGAVTTATYTIDGRVNSVSNGAGTTSYGYDAADDVTSMTDANKHTTTYTYDGAGRLASTTVNGNKTAYGRDVAGNVTTVTDPDGRTTSYTLNALNQATSTRYTAPGAAAITVTQTFDPLGRRTAMTDPTGSHSYSYDTAGDLTSASGPSGTFTYDYNTQPGKIVETYPDHTQVTYSVDDNQNLMGVQTGTQGQAGYVQASYIRNPLRETTGIAFSNGVLETQTFNQQGNVTDQTLQVAGTTIADNAFAYDAGGNRLAQVDNVGGNATTNQYGYDSSERLTGFSTATAPSSVTSASPPPALPNPGSMTTSGTPTGPSAGSGTTGGTAPTVTPPSPSLTYDGTGNRLTSPGTTYSYNAGDELTSQNAPGGTTSYQYDKNGDLSSAAGPGGTTTYGYNAADQLAAVKLPSGQTIAYAYDGDGNRVTKSVNGTLAETYVWDSAGPYPRLAIEQDGSGNLIRRYIYGDGPVAMQTPTATYFYHLDPEGSVSELTNSSGAVVASYHYDAFGNVSVDQAGAPANPLLFQGQYLDGDTHLYDMRARNYDAATGRFTQRDPAATPAGVPTVSPYVFVADRPTAGSDPTGRSAISAVTTFWANPLGAFGVDTSSAGISYAQTEAKVVTEKLGAAALGALVKSGVKYLKNYLSSKTSDVTDELAQDTGEIAAGGESELPAVAESADGVASTLGAEAGPATEAAAESSGTLAKVAGPALAVIGIGIQTYFTVEDCLHGTAYQCAGAVIGTAVSIGFTIGCTVLTEGAGAIACGLVGGIISTSLQFVVTTFGPQIVAGVVSLYDDAAAAIGPEIPVITQALVGAADDVGNAFVSAGGSIATGFNEATGAISSGFQSAVTTLVDAGYSAVQLATVLANTFQQGANAAIGALISFGYSVDQVAQAAFNTFKLGAEEAAQLFKNAFNYTVAQVATFLNDVYKQAAQDAAQILKDVSFAVDEVASALDGVYKQAVADIAATLKAVGYEVQQIGAALQQVFHEADQAVAAALNALGYAVDAVARTLVSLYNDIDSAVASALNFAGYVANDIMTALHDVFTDAAQVAAGILKGLNFLANDIAGALHSVYTAIDETAAQILENIGFGVAVVAQALSTVFHDIDSTVASVLKQLGNAVSDIASALHTVFVTDLDSDIAAALKIAGFVATDIATAIHAVFTDIDTTVATILNDLGFGVNDIANALRSVFTSDGAQAIAAILKNTLHDAVDVVAGVLEQVFGNAASDAAAILSAIGFGVSDIATALKDVYNQVASAVASILKGLSAAASDIASVLGSLFGMASSDIGNLLSDIGFSNSVIDAIGGAFSSFGQSVADCFSSFFSDC